ncbi:MAG: type II toxin-antitoxin system HicA family toxin [Chloroflexota bacterium]|nr:type II toxin-antitoxin system HicA family toxin [Chloroflexota bacterium]
MSKLPVISGRVCIKALEKAGFKFIRQKGSHISMLRENPYAQVVVPNHRELDRGTLRAIIRQAGLSVEEFIGLLG